jgi:hypothetical protein
MNGTGINPIDPRLGFPCPLTLTCTVSGNQVVYSNPDYIKKRIEKAGSLEALLKSYVSKEGKSQQKSSQPRALNSKASWGVGPQPERKILYQIPPGAVIMVNTKTGEEVVVHRTESRSLDGTVTVCTGTSPRSWYVPCPTECGRRGACSACRQDKKPQAA